MQKILKSRTLVVVSLLATLSAVTPGIANAREGAQSIGQGIKCYTGLVLQADGSYTIGRVCYKGV